MLLEKALQEVKLYVCISSWSLEQEVSMYSAAQELQYLDMVVQESLRMYPASPR